MARGGTHVVFRGAETARLLFWSTGKQPHRDSAQFAQHSEVNFFEPRDLLFLIEFLRDNVGSVSRKPRQEMSILHRVQERFRKRFMVALRDEEAAYAVLDCFRNSAVNCRKHRQAG